MTKGFSIFYIGINIRIIISDIGNWNCCCPMGMACWFWFSRKLQCYLALLVYIWGQKYISHVGNKPTVEEMKNDISLVKIFSNIFKSPAQLVVLVILLALSLYAGFTFVRR